MRAHSKHKRNKYRTKKLQQFDVGDKVKVVKRKYSWTQPWLKGVIGTIVEINENFHTIARNHTYKIKCEDKEEWVWVSDLEKVK